MSSRRCGSRFRSLPQIRNGASPDYRTAKTRRQWNPHHPSLILYDSWHYLRTATQRRPLCPARVDSQSPPPSQSPALAPVERVRSFGHCWPPLAACRNRRARRVADSKGTLRIAGLSALRWETLGMTRRT